MVHPDRNAALSILDVVFMSSTDFASFSRAKALRIRQLLSIVSPILARVPIGQGSYRARVRLGDDLLCPDLLCDDRLWQKEYSLRISIIGAGNVGRAIGRAAFLAGDEIVDVVCTAKSSATAATRFIGAGTARESVDAALEAADLIIISTQDDRIDQAVRLVRRAAGLTNRSGAQSRLGHSVTVLHTSGALSSKVLAPLKPAGFVIGSCHPLQTFESARRSVAAIRRSYFCIEGEPPAVRAARKFVRSIGGRFFEIPTAQKELYHAGAVLASGGLTALLSISLEILGRCGLNEKAANRVLFPLIEGTMANIQAVGPARALTGPVRRRDAGTIRRNIRALACVDQDWAKIYKLLAKRSFTLLA